MSRNTLQEVQFYDGSLTNANLIDSIHLVNNSFSAGIAELTKAQVT
jgi:hypothetical protein